MITSTILAIFFTPVFYAVFQWLSERFGGRQTAETETEQEASAV